MGVERVEDALRKRRDGNAGEVRAHPEGAVGREHEPAVRAAADPHIKSATVGGASIDLEGAPAIAGGAAVDGRARILWSSRGRRGRAGVDLKMRRPAWANCERPKRGTCVKQHRQLGSSEQHAAVHHHRCTGHVRRRLRCEERSHLGDVVGDSHAP